MGGFAAIGSPDVLGLVSGAKPVQTIWSDTTVRATGGQTGTFTVVEKVIPAGTLNRGGAIKFRFDGVASMSSQITLFFNWATTDVITLSFPSPGTAPFYMDIVITHNPTSDTNEVVIAKTGNSAAPLSLYCLGAFADITQDIVARLNVLQGSAQDQIQLAFAYAALLNPDGPI